MTSYLMQEPQVMESVPARLTSYAWFARIQPEQISSIVLQEDSVLITQDFAMKFLSTQYS